MSVRLDYTLIDRRARDRRAKAQVVEVERRRTMRRQPDGRSPLARYRLFQGLNAEQLSAIEEIMTVEKYKKGEIIIREGEVGGEMYVLLTGSIEISKRMTFNWDTATGRREKSLKQLHDEWNIFFGEMSMFGNEQRSATVTALTDVMLGVLTCEQVESLSRNDPALGFFLFFNIGEKIATTLRWANRDILKLTTAFVLALEGL